ncbi:MAG: hypothetical protein LUC16_02640 [Coprobacillus sp.]|nr:hypothetical protein [Coprobacillus sp.]
MKKSSMFLIVVVFAVAIVVVSFFGQAISMDQFKVYMTTLEITNEYQTWYDSAGNPVMKMIMLPYDWANGWSSVFLTFETGPEDATEKDAVRCYLANNTYTMDNGETGYYADIVNLREVVFYKPATVKAYVTTTDGSGLTDSIDIWCYDPNVYNFDL